MNLLFDIFSKIKSDCISGLTDELKTQYILYLFKKQPQNMIVLTNNLYNASLFYDYIKTYIDDVFLFPVDEFITNIALAASPDLKIKRLETLNIINNNKDTPKIIVTNLMGFLKFVPNSSEIANTKITIKQNVSYDRQELETSIENLGYQRTTIVTSSGEYSIRGFIIDIFPYNCDNPVRIELFGNTIEKIRFFDTETQLSLKEVSKIEILPFNEIETTKMTSLSELIKDPLIIKIDDDLIESSYHNIQEQIVNYNIENNLKDDKKYMYEYNKIPQNKVINLSSYNQSNYYNVLSKSIDNFHHNFELLKKFIDLNQKDKIVIFAVNDMQLTNYLQQIFKITKSQNYQIGNCYIINTKLNQGFIIDNYLIISSNDIKPSEIKHNYNNLIKIGRKIKDFNEIKKGDYVVHYSHGIGIYNGVTTLTQNGIQKDYIQINYADNDKIYIPVEKINTIFKYSDAEGIPPKIYKLNSINWIKTRTTVKNKAKDISKELLKLYTERAQIKSPKFKEFAEETIFANNFEYSETKDQTKCILEVLNDLQSEKPMDRLLCGDVGFGKTEVAFRGIFNTILNGYQVAYLCPTTILSKQQYESALKRFSNYPVNIALINRFTPEKEYNKILTKIQEGKIDLLFGTHRLFNKSIQFKNLGLLIIDEEQRFGVVQKEKLKNNFKNVNILTLSATPIPRTLKMAMSGLKDLSILDTAPQNRYPVQTYVIKQSDLIIKEAIYKELSRHGQVFYLYNNIENIEQEVNRVQKLVPEAKICYAHGRMDKSKLENIVDRFINKEYDILLCTTIIETGIDISNVNTLIIIEAEKYGLSQLYQLRGRVGRSDRIAYAYLFYNNKKILSEVAEKRLKAIKEFTELGSGYKIAMRDLAIRGAGNLLGSEQAGFIETVGIDLFTKLIEESINELRGIDSQPDELSNPLINVDTHIDEQYVPDESVRIEIHKLINEIKDYTTLTKIKSEIEDRFGKIDNKIQIYMYEELFEKLAQKLNIKHIIQTKTFIEIYLPQIVSEKINGEKLFLKIISINQKFTIRYLNKQIIIKLPIINLPKHYLYYLIELIEEIINDIE